MQRGLRRNSTPFPGFQTLSVGRQLWGCGVVGLPRDASFIVRGDHFCRVLVSELYDIQCSRHSDGRNQEGQVDRQVQID